MIGPFSRIIARYLASAMVTYGLLAEPDVIAMNPDVIMIIGLVLGGAVEMAYATAKKAGWVT